jgi:hypothetical protein
MSVGYGLPVLTPQTQWFILFNEIGKDTTLNTPVTFPFGGNTDGSASEIYSETMGDIFSYATGYEVVNNAARYGIGDEAALDIGNSMLIGAAALKATFDAYVAAGAPFSSWNPYNGAPDPTIGTLTALAWKFIEHAELQGLGYRTPARRLMTLLQMFSPSMLASYDPQDNTQAGATYRSTLLVTALSYAFSEDLRSEFRALNFPIDDAVYAQLYNQATVFASGVPALIVGKTHNGDFTQGQTGATYTVMVSNQAGAGPTNGTATVTETVPSAMTLVSMAGTGWTCAANTCTRSDALPSGASYSAITVTINVASNAPAQATNQVSVSGGGSVTATASDPTTIATGCSYTLSANSSTARAAAGNGSVTVTAPAGCAWTAASNASWLTITSGTSGAGTGSASYTVAANSGPGSRSGTLTVNGSTAILTFTVSQASPGSNVGIFRSGYFWLEDVDGNHQFNSPPDRAFAFGGIPGDIPIAGDWNGSGTTKVGVYRTSNGLFILDYDGDGQFTSADKVYSFGVGTQPGDIPVVGDWNGDGRTKIGLFRQGFYWILDTNGNGTFDAGDQAFAYGGDSGDQVFAFGGITGDVPVVGDWNGDGRTKVGVFRMGFFWVLDTNGNQTFDAGTDQAFAFGGINGDIPVVGKW